MTKVLLINWDNYPNIASGGVYAWAKMLVESLSEFDFAILNCLSNPNVNSKYKLPTNVSKVIEIPLYGTMRPEEFYFAKSEEHASPNILVKQVRTTDKEIKNKFTPIFEELITELTSSNCDTRRVVDVLVELQAYAKTHDLKTTLESVSAFDSFIRVLCRDTVHSRVSIKEATDLFSFIQRVLVLISIPLPRVDLTHASNAWFPALAGVCLRRTAGVPMVVTEHGVAYKDLLLYDRLFERSPSYNALWKGILTNIIRTVYDNCELISPVCEANTGIVKLLGTRTQIRVCYNGIDTQKFRPVVTQKDATESGKPTVVYVGRIELLKDLLNLIESISYVKNHLDNVLCKIYGSSTDLSYAKECLALVEELGLGGNILFMGATPSPEIAYNSGDIVVLSSIREGFPYTVIEAMACGKVVVATNVGGVYEALGNSGFLVKSRHPYELSVAILRALTDAKLRNELGLQAIRVVEQKFTLEKSLSEVRKIYAEVLGNNAFPVATPASIGVLGGVR